ncbi:MAG: hypothetical protein KJ571_16110 [Bacteroidetes bacterium]|nr:hypothetical protein [Bacteroidota bacterium]
MKKPALLLFFFIVFGSFVNAQGFQKDSKQINAGIGFGLPGIYGDSDLPPVSVGFQYGIDEKISIGGIVGLSTSSYSDGWYNDNYKWSFTYFIIGARGEYHFLKNEDKFDAYAGVTLAYNNVSVSEPSGYNGLYTYDGSYMIYGAHVGGRYAFSETLGAFAEIGYGIGYLTFGVSYNLK